MYLFVPALVVLLNQGVAHVASVHPLAVVRKLRTVVALAVSVRAFVVAPRRMLQRPSRAAAVPVASVLHLAPAQKQRMDAVHVASALESADAQRKKHRMPLVWQDHITPCRSILGTG